MDSSTDGRPEAFSAWAAEGMAGWAIPGETPEAEAVRIRAGWPRPGCAAAPRSLFRRVPLKLHRAGIPIRSMEEWLAVAPPPRGGEWRAGRAPWELARAWIPGEAGPVVPPELEALFRGSPDLKDVTFLEAQPGAAVEVGSVPGGPEVVDLALLGEDPGGRVGIVVEGKVDEPFGDRVELLQGRARQGVAGAPEKAERVQALAGLLLPPWQEGQLPLGELRAPLLAGVAAALGYAASVGATRAAFVVHEVVSLSKTSEARRRNNREELDRFVRRLTGGVVERLQRGVPAGPVRVPAPGPGGEMALYRGKVRRDQP